MRHYPLIHYLDQRIVDIGVLYQSTDRATTWIPFEGVIRRRNEIIAACQDLHTFEFEFEFGPPGSERRGKNH